MAEKVNRTTAADFRLFKAEAKKWIERFGLKEYRVSFVHETSKEFAATRAWFHSDGTIAEIGLSQDWAGDEVTKSRVALCAFHEVCHILLDELAGAAAARDTTLRTVEYEEEKIIHRLEWAIAGGKVDA